ncbi:PH domain-containing protein [Nonomuraea sp. NPDC050310]|uniref:PH domain-containing protein n=1 Tax=unclassified Nonomuraea TaxID=2593643 RepID=UPI0033DAED9D
MKQTFRSTTAFVFGWVWLAFVAFNAYDLTANYTGKGTLVAAAVLGGLTALVYLTGLRPATTLTDEALVVRNPFRSVTLPWSTVGDVQVGHSISVEYGEPDAQGKPRVLRLWTPMASARERAKAQQRALPKPQRGKLRTEPARTKAEQAMAEAMAGKTHADWVGEQVTQRAEAARMSQAAPGEVRMAWAYDSFAVVLAALALVVVAVLA